MNALSKTTSSSELSEILSIRIRRRDKQLLERICRARGEDPSEFGRRAMRKEFANLCYLPQEEKKALGLSYLDSSRTP